MFEDLDLVCMTWGLRALESSLELIGRQLKYQKLGIFEGGCLAKALEHNKQIIMA